MALFLGLISRTAQPPVTFWFQIFVRRRAANERYSLSTMAFKGWLSFLMVSVRKRYGRFRRYSFMLWAMVRPRKAAHGRQKRSWQ